jgi:hypothetical protein
MTGVPVNLAFLLPECVDNQVGKAAHAVKEFSFSGPEIICDGRLHQMAGCIKFVPLAQIAPSSFRIRQGIEGIDISVAALGFRDQIDHFVGCFFQLLILIIRQGKSDRFQPFGCIGILERRPVKSPGGPAGGDIPTLTLTAAELSADGRVSTMLVRSGLCKSQSDARTQIAQNAVSIGNDKVTDPAAVLTADQLSGDGILIRKGKKGFCRVILG